MFVAISRRAPLTALAVLLASCGGDKRADDAPPAGAVSAGDTSASPSNPNVVTFTANDFAFEGPSEIPAGVTALQLVNHGPSMHHIQLMRFEEGKSLEDFLGAMKGEEFPGWATSVGGPAPPAPNDTSTVIQDLAEGNYGLICFIPSPDGVPHVAKGMSRALKVVSANGPPAAEPETDLVIKLLDYDFQLSAPITAGKHTIRVENLGAQHHEIAIAKLNPGKKPSDVTAWGMKQVGPPPGIIYGGLSGIMPGAHAIIEVDLPAGEYGLLCFLPDTKDGKPHFMHGMQKATTVTS